MTLEELKSKRDRIAAVCRAHGVARLDVFGSVVREEATPESDVDLLVDLLPSSEKTYVRLERIGQALQDVLSAPTDLVLSERLTNPYVKRSVDRERQNLYGA